MLVLAHLSDPHLGPLPSMRVVQLVGKRLTGFINWRRIRQFRHQPRVLDALVRDLQAQQPDHIAVTGDLANLGLPGEFAAGRAFLDQLGPAHDVTLVPGNHDVYVRKAVDRSRRHWADYMHGDTHGEVVSFPFVRRRGAVALIGLSSAVPTRPFMATGFLGRTQLRALANVLDDLAARKLFRIVLIHHPPATRPGKWNKRLVDAPNLQKVLADHGAELVLHGHNHEDELVWLAGPQRPIPAVGVPSASMGPNGHEHPAAYNLYRIDGEPGAWTCEATSRGLQPDGSIIETARRWLLARE